MTDRLTESLLIQKQQTKQDIPELTGILGIPLGGVKRVEVPNRNAYVYVRLRNNSNEIIEAFNNQVAPSYNLPVKLQRQGNRYVVLGVDTQRYENNWNSFAPFLPRHGNTHSFDTESGGGGDLVWVYPRQFMPSLVLPSGSAGAGNVILSPYTLKKDNGSWLYVGNTGTPSIIQYNPTSVTGAIMVLVYLDTSTGNPGLLVGSGTVFLNSITGSSQIAQYIPSVLAPATQIPLAAIRLITGTAAISWDNIYDVRQFLHNSPTGTGGGTLIIQDEGVSQGTATTLNFVGDNVQATVAGGVARIYVTGSTGSGGINTGTLDARYLRLDASNDPVTGPLLIQGQRGVGGNLLTVDMIDDTYIPLRITHRPSGAYQVGDDTISVLREADGGAEFPFNAIYIRDLETNGKIQGKVFSADKNSVERVAVHPYATGTAHNYLWDTDRTRPTGTIHTSFRVSGTEVAYLDASGTFYSNGSPLIKEAPIDSQFYVRKNAGWEALKSGVSTLGAGINLTGSAGAYQEITGISLTLPEAGTYKLTADVRAAVDGNAGSFWWIAAKLRNATTNTDLPNSERIIVFTNSASFQFQNTASINEIITVTGSHVIKLYATRDGIGPPTYDLSNIGSDTNGRTKMMYEKIG